MVRTKCVFVIIIKSENKCNATLSPTTDTKRITTTAAAQRNKV